MTNGSFEDPVIGSDFVVFSAGSSAITGWSINSESVDINRNGVLGTAATAQDGNQWLDLNGFDDANISQLLPTVPGQAYELEFFFSDNPFNNGNGSQLGVEKTGTFSLRNAFNFSQLLQFGTFSHSSASGADLAWTELSASFTAVSTLTRLAFQGDADSGSTGPFIDAVSVTAVAEPGTLSLLAAGVLAAGWWRRARRDAAAG